jgi:hypothetical protein
MAVATVPPSDYQDLPANTTPNSASIDLTISTGVAGGHNHGDR